MHERGIPFPVVLPLRIGCVPLLLQVPCNALLRLEGAKRRDVTQFVVNEWAGNPLKGHFSVVSVLGVSPSLQCLIKA
jgi:hypothetical protein